MNPDERAVASAAAEPAATPAGLGRDAIFCPQCPGWYPIKYIHGRSSTGDVRPWSEVALRVSSHTRSPWARLFGGRQSRLSMRQRADIAGKSYVPECPLDHRLPNTVDHTSVIGVIGNVGSSKSHFLAGLAYEMIHEQPLRHLNMDVAYLRDEAQEMEERVNRVYAAGEILRSTERGSIDGPFSYRLTTNARSGNPDRHTLSFFDVAGEDCTSLTRAAEFVRYLFSAAGIILLIDPGGLPAKGKPFSVQGSMRLTTRAIVDSLADALETVTGVPSREQPHVIVVTLSKADDAELPPDIWPPHLWDDHGVDVPVTRTRERLRDYSTRCRESLIEIGARGIVEAAETRFDRRKVFYAASSATGESPYGDRWTSPAPVGCITPLALILTFGEH